MVRPFLLAALALFVTSTDLPAMTVTLSATNAAASVDKLLASELATADGSADATPPKSVDDETYLRRVYLDLIGQQPTPEEITAFALDARGDKRSRVVDRLLADPRYGRNWARYWRDVILYRRSDPRALIAAQSLTDYLAGEFNRGTSWNEIARSLLTAKGNLSEDGRTGLLAAQWGEVPDTAAEVVRILLGIQIQCAQCHDHKTDRWKRTQFHELAAFFPRIAIRPIRNGEKRIGFELVAKDDYGNPVRKQAMKQKRIRRLEYYMPDLDNPSAEGTLMQPVFFVTGQKLPEGATDEERREKLAQWITARKDPWFARAVVNRIWAELVGEGFYEPIDDLGPDKTCTAPKTMDLLADQFVDNGYDLRWLLRTITATEIYGRESRARRNANQTPFEAVCPQPLRADQLFDNLASALGIEEDRPDGSKRPTAPGAAARFLTTPRGRFLASFGFDPSAPRDELTGSIDQALLMMNNNVLAAALAARPTAQGRPTLLAQLIDSGRKDDEIVLELYLRTLSREPKPSEMETCRQYLAGAKDRIQGLEDILWALVNSTEFLYRQ